MNIWSYAQGRAVRLCRQRGQHAGGCKESQVCQEHTAKSRAFLRVKGREGEREGDGSLTGVFIQVGNAFNNDKTYRELKEIASNPKETHTFKVNNYTVLDNLLLDLQQSIIYMEGEGSHRSCESPPAFSRTPSPRPTLPDSDHLPEPQLLFSKMALTPQVLLSPPNL